MMNRNLRIFEKISNELKNATSNEVYKWEKEIADKLVRANRQSYLASDFQSEGDSSILNPILMVGFNEP